MTDTAALDAHAMLVEPITLRLQRRLPGPIERVWAHLTDGELRRRWLAAGTMEMAVGAPFELVWRNDDLSGGQGGRPTGFPAEQRMKSLITELDPPNRISFTWDGSGDVTFELRPDGGGVLLTVTHRRLPDRATLLDVGAGWHMHLDILAAVASGRAPDPFWEGWIRLRADYDRRLPD